MVKQFNKLVSIILLIACVCCLITYKSFAYNVSYTPEKFRQQYTGIIDFEATDYNKYLSATMSINSDFYIPNTGIKVSSYYDLKESEHYIYKISQKYIDCHVAMIYTIQDTKWAYVTIDQIQGLYGWVCTNKLRFDIPENNTRYSSLAPSQSVIDIMKNNIYLGFTVIGQDNIISGIQDGSIGGTVGGFDNPTDKTNGRNPIIIEAPKPYYEIQDLMQFGLTILLSIILGIIILYTYTVIWGESQADTIYTVIVNGSILALSWLIIIVRIIFILRGKGVIETTDMSVISTVLIIVGCIAGAFNIDSSRVGRPILYTACSHCLTAIIMSGIMSLYSYYVGILNMWDTFIFPVFRTLDSYVYCMISLIIILLTIALYNRYTFSYTEERAQIRAMVKTRYAVLHDEDELINDSFVLNKSDKRTFMSVLYEDGLPTLNDFVCELRNRAKGLDR